VAAASPNFSSPAPGWTVRVKDGAALINIRFSFSFQLYRIKNVASSVINVIQLFCPTKPFEGRLDGGEQIIGDDDG